MAELNAQGNGIRRQCQQGRGQMIGTVARRVHHVGAQGYGDDQGQHSGSHAPGDGTLVTLDLPEQRLIQTAQGDRLADGLAALSRQTHDAGILTDR